MLCRLLDDFRMWLVKLCCSMCGCMCLNRFWCWVSWWMWICIVCWVIGLLLCFGNIGVLVVLLYLVCYVCRVVCVCELNGMCCWWLFLFSMLIRLVVKFRLC